MRNLLTKKINKNFLNQSGSAILQAMIAAGILSIVGMGVASLSKDLSQTQRQARFREDAIVAARLLGSVASSNFLCAKAMRTDNGNFRTVDFNSAAGQRLEICLPYFTDDGDCENAPADKWFPQPAAPNNRFGTTDLRVREISYFNPDVANPENVQCVPGVGCQYTGELRAQFEPVTGITGIIALKPREGSVNFRVATDNAGKIIGCSAEGDPGEFCRAVGGIWDPLAPPPEPPCQMPLPPLTCPAGQVMVGLNADGTARCATATVDCPVGMVLDSVRMDSSGVRGRCVPVGAWDYSDWLLCGTGGNPPGQTTRTVRCVNGYAMDAWMRANNFTTFQANIPPNILLSGASENYCDPATRPINTDVCVMPSCTVLAGTTWAGGACRSDAEVIITNGSTGTLADTIGDPDYGSATFSCSGNPAVANYVAGTCGPPPATDCVQAAGSLTWTVGANTCTNTAAITITDGMTTLTTDTTAPETGVANFACAATVATVQPGATCSIAAPGDCIQAAGSLTWTVAGETCTNTAAITILDGTSSNAADTVGPVSGDASFSCVGGVATVQPGSTCRALDGVWVLVDAGGGIPQPCPGGYVRTDLEDDTDAGHRFWEDSREGAINNLCVAGITGYYWAAFCNPGDLDTLIHDDTEPDRRKLWEGTQNGGGVTLCFRHGGGLSEAGYWPACPAGYVNLGGMMARRNGRGNYESRNINQDASTNGSGWYYCVK